MVGLSFDDIEFDPESLVTFGGKGHYEEPEATDYGLLL